MSAEATDVQDLAGPIPAPPARPTASERAEQLVKAFERTVFEVWIFVRLLLFFLYLLLGVLCFWLWAFSLLFGAIRLALRMMMLSLLWLSGGTAPPPGPPAQTLMEVLQRELRYLWSQRFIAYEDSARPIARQWRGAVRANRTFWYWSLPRKGLALLVVGVLVAIPAIYVIPRPVDVQVTDDNAVEYDKSTNKTTYLVNALDLHVEGKHLEYVNEDAWYLGKINSQGLKSQLQIGRMYRFWVVGIRWFWMPKLYPNIISATEIDATEQDVKHPGLLAAPPPAPSQLPPPK